MKKYMYQKGLHIFSLFICLALGILSVNAQSTTASTGDWNTAATFGGTLPASGNTVTVNKAITVNGTVLNSVGAISVASGGTITFGASGILNATSITIASGGSLVMTAGGVLNVSGTVTVASGATCNWTPPSASVTGVQVQAWSGGGGGGGTSSSANYYSAGGGAGGNFITAIPTVASGTNYTVTVGAGGAAGGTGSLLTCGGLGGTTSFSTGGTALVSIPGGTPGYGGTAAQKSGLGGLNTGGIYLVTVTTAGAYINSAVVPKVIVGNQWSASTAYTVGQQVAYLTNLYTVTVAGTSTATAPTNTSGSSSAGTTGAVFTYAGTPATATSSITAGPPNTLAYIAFTPGSGYTSAPSIILDQPWSAGQNYTAGYEYTAGGNLYQVSGAGTSGSTAPTGTSATATTAGTGGTATYIYLGVAATVRAVATASVNKFTVSTSGAVNYSATPTVIPAYASYSIGGAGGNGATYVATATTNSSGGGGGSPTNASANGTAGTNATTGVGGAGAAGVSGSGGTGATTAAATGTVGGAATGVGNGGGGSTSKSALGGVGSGGQVIFSYTNVTTSGSLAALSTIYGTASTFTSFNVSATNAFSGITVTAPTGFEVCATSGGSYASSVVIGAAGTISSTPVYIRLAATTVPGTYGTGGTGTTTIQLTSTGYSSTMTMTASTVSALTLTVDASKITANDKAYNGTTAAALTFGSGVLVGILGSDAVSLSNTYTANFASAGVYDQTNSYAVSVSALALTGANAAYYSIAPSYPLSVGSANITPTTADTLLVGALSNASAFGSLTVGQTTSATFNLTGLNLNGSSISLSAPSGYSISPSTISGYGTSIDQTITLSFNPVAATSYSGNLTISGGGAASASVAITGTGLAPNAATGLSVAYNSDNAQQLNWTAPVGSYSKVLVFASTSAVAYPASGLGSLYTGANANIASATTYGNSLEYSLVYAGTGSSVEVTNLTAGTTYFYTVVAYVNDVYSSATIVSKLTLTVPAPVTALAAASANTQSTVTWTNPSVGTTHANYWDKILVVAYPTVGSSGVVPTGDGSAYIANATYGSGSAYDNGYVVYNGTGSTVTVTSLANLTNYTIAVFTRHGNVWSNVVSTTVLPSQYAIGDFVSVATGNYNANATWNIWNGSALVASPCTVNGTSYTTPAAANNVWIVGNDTVTVSTTGSSAAACNNLHVLNGKLLSVNNLSLTGSAASSVILMNGTLLEMGASGTIGNGLSGDNANGISLAIVNAGTTTITGTGGVIDFSKLLINTSGANLVIDHNITVHYHTTTNSGNGQAFGCTIASGSASTTINANKTLTFDQLCGLTLGSSTGSVYAINYTLDVYGSMYFTRGKPNAISATSTNGAFTLNAATGNLATLNIHNGGSVTATEFYPNGVGASGANGLGSVSTINIDNGGTFTVDSLIDLRNPLQTIGGTGSFRLQSNNGTGTIVKIGSTSGINAQILTSTQYLTDAKTTFTYESSAAQVTGTNLPSSVYRLRINNVNGVSLSQAVTVTDSLYMQNGLLNTTSSNLLTIGANGVDSCGTATSTTSYINGPMAYIVASTSAKTKTFTIGASGTYSPFTLNVTQNTSSARTYLATSYSGAGSITPSYTNNTGTIAYIDPRRYYTISSTGSGAVTAAKVTLNYSTAADVLGGNSFITSSPSRMRVVGSTGTSWTDLGGTGVAISTGVGSVAATSNFNTLGTFAVANAIALNTSPDLIPAVSATVTANYTITFADDATWRAAITSVVIGSRTLTRNTDYTISAGALTIMPNGAIGNLLRTAGTLAIVVNAAGYDVASVDQVVTSGAATKLLVNRAPAATSNGAAFSTQPIVYITDDFNNVVTTATDNITPSNTGGSNAGSWTLGGTLTALATTNGVATFTNLSGSSSTALNVTITFTSTSYGSVTTTFNLVAPPTYYWVGGTTAAALNAPNVWSTTKGGTGILSFTPSATDVLIFDGKNLGGGITSGTIQTWGPSTTTTLGQVILQNNATVLLAVSPTSASRTYNIGGLYGTDLVIGSGSTLNLSTGSTTVIAMQTGATASISGNLIMGAVSSANDVFSGTAAGAIQFNNGSVCTVNGNSGTSPFGTTVSGSVVFNSGSELIWNKSGDVFGGNNVVTFNNGSLFYMVYNATGAQLFMDGHTFGNIEVNNTGTTTSNTGTNGFTCQSLKIDGVSKFVIGSTGGNSTIGSVTTASGSTLTVNNSLVYTTLNNSGTINLNGTSVLLSGANCGNIVLAGSSAQTISGTGTVNNLTLNNATGATVSSGNNSLSITGILTLTSGQLATNDNVTLKSTSVTNTAIVAPVVGSITGKVTVERFIPYGKRTYRDLGPEVSNAGSIYTNWQEAGINNNGYGIQITGSQGLGTGTDPVTGFDYSLTGNHSLYTYTNNAWDSVTNSLTTNLNPYQGYRVLVRGDRSGSLQTQFLYNTAATLRAKGNLITGTVTMNTSNALTSGVGSYSFIANPYVCPVYWNSVMTGATTGISGSYWYCDPTFTTNPNWGGYTTFVAYNNVSGVSNPLGHSLINGYLQPGQAVFVQNTSASPSLVFTEASKSIAQTKTAIFGTAINRIAVGLNKDGSNVDGAVTAFASDFSTAIGTEDAIKFPNGGENIAFTFGAKDLCINATVLPTASDVFPIHLYNLTANSAYSLRLDVSQFTGNGVKAYLMDNVSNTKTLLSGDNTIIAFNTNSVNAVNYAKRYSIVFGNSTLPVSDIKLTASVKASTVQVDWSVVGEVAVSNYGVQHSVDGATFTNIATVTANNSSAYAVTDTKAVTGTNYYRIKVSSIDGTVSYSNVVAVSIGKAVASIAAYPNPLVGQKLNVSFNNLEAGKYSLAVYDAIGKKVVEKSISHIGGTVVEQLSINSHLAAGTYTVHVSNVNGISYQSKVEVK